MAVPKSLATASTPIPSITGGAAAPSGVESSNAIRFGGTYVYNGGNAIFWLAFAGAGFLVWKTLTK